MTQPFVQDVSKDLARRLIAQTVSTSSFACTDAGLTFAAMSPSADTHAARLPKMTSLEVRGKD